MAKRLPPEEMVKITLDTSTMQDFDPESKLPLGTFKFILKDLEKDLGTFERALQSSTNYFEFFSNSLKKIDKDSGLAEQSFFIRKSEFDNAKTALIQTNQQIATLRGSELGYNISAKEAELVTGKRTLHGKYAQKKAMEELERLGGTMTADPKHKDKFDISIPFAKSELEGLSDKEKSSLITKAMPNARKLSNIENRKISADRKEKERKALEQEEARKKKEEEKAQAERARDKKKRETEQKKAQQASAHKRLAVTKAVFATLVILTDITRRILSNMFKQAQKNDRDSVSAHTIGLTLAQKRNLDTFDVAHGLEAGDSFRAIQVIQQKWGDVTNLDEEGLGVLARVMGSKVGDFVNSGMGGKNPDKLFDMILDDFFKQYLDGKNSLGQEVGRAQARRELTTVLAGVSPEIAKVFERMIDDLESGYYRKFKNATEWRGTTPVNTKGLTTADDDYSVQLGKVYNEILADFKQLRESFLEKLLIECDSLLLKIKGFRFGESADKTIEVDSALRDKYIEQNKELSKVSSALTSSSEDRVKAKLTALNLNPKFNQRKVNVLAQDIFALAEGNFSEKTLKAKYKSLSEAGRKNLLKAYGITDPNAFDLVVKQTQDTYKQFLLDSDLSDELSYIHVIAEIKKKLQGAIDTPVGKKVPEVLATPATVREKAQEYLVDQISKVNAYDIDPGTLGEKKALQAVLYYFEKNPSKVGAVDSLIKNNKLWQEVKSGITKDPNYQADFKELLAQREALGGKKYGEELRKLVNAYVLVHMITRTGLDVNKLQDNAFFTGEDVKGIKTFFENAFKVQPKKDLEMSDAKVLQILSQQNLNTGKYSFESKQGASNQLIIDIQQNGKHVDTIEIPNTSGGRYKGKFSVNSDGQLYGVSTENIETNPSRNASN